MTTTTCPGCHGAGTEMSGTTHAGLAEHLACDECGPDCPQDCGCRVDDAAERPESIAPRHPGATQSPDGSQGAPEGPRGAEGATGRRDVDMQGSAFCSRHHYGCIGGSSTCRRCWPLKGHSEVSFRTPWQEVPDGR